jgi:L-fuculose-phosphate aldolase
MSSLATRQMISITSSESASESETGLRRQLVRYGRWAYRLGYTPGTAGNLSVRLDRDLVLATPTGCSKGLLRAAEMVIVDLDGHQISGNHAVTSEIGMHLTVYRMRPDVEAIVHTHPPITTAFAACGKALDEPICSEILMSTGPVPLAPYATTGTEEVGQSLRPYIPNHDAILLANHGLLTYGTSLAHAFMKTETVEHFAQVCLAAHQLGGARHLSGSQIDRLRESKISYLRNASLGPRLT